MYNWETAKYGNINYIGDINYLRYFERKFLAIVYDDALSSQHVDEVNWKNETSLSEYDDGKYNTISESKALKKRFSKKEKFNILSIDKDLFSYDIFYVNELKLDKDNGEDKIGVDLAVYENYSKSNYVQVLNVDSLKVDLVVIQNTCSEKEDNNSETAFNRPVKESSMNSETKDVHAIKYKMSKAKERCMAYFHSLHSHLQVLSKEDLKFRDTLLQNMGNVKKFFAERARHQKQYDRRVNKRQMQTQESKTDTDDSSRSGNDTDTDDADIRPIYDEEPMTEYPEQCQVKSPMLDSSPDNQTTEYSKQSLKYDSYDVNDRVENFIRSLFYEYFNGENLVVSKSSAVTTADASDKRQQQPDSTSSISTLATTVTAYRNFDL
ncbi:hypothetical protein Tco_0860220 [Tanacetum coccineum]|uniref:Uncharacterized protein n=1 Tax=Tanacetum coccineum TaxID=301880 RepID=A0ABQ5BF44_9ASTR